MTDDTSTLKRWTCVNHTHKDVQEVSLVPNLYVPIATCCHVREPLNVGEFGGNSAYDNVNVYLATNRGQLLSFVNGRLRTYWQRPLQNVDSGGNKYTFAVNVLTLFWNNVWSCTLFVWQREVWWGILLVLATNVSATLLEIIIRLVEELLSVERGFLNLSHCSQQHAQHLSFFNEWSVCCSLLQCVTDYLPDPDSQKLQCRYQQNGWESLIPIAACDQSEFPCNFSHWNIVKKNTVQNISSLLSQFLHNQFCNQEVKCFKPLPAFYFICSLVVWSSASWLHCVHNPVGCASS